MKEHISKIKRQKQRTTLILGCSADIATVKVCTFLLCKHERSGKFEQNTSFTVIYLMKCYRH